MKKNKLLCLLPILCISGCIGANWQVDIKRAKTVANKILEAQESEDFNILTMSNEFYYENSFFELLDKYNEHGDETSLESNYYFNSYLLNYKSLTFFARSREKSTFEGHESSSDDKSSRWIYVDGTTLYDVVDTGKKDGRTYKKKTISPDDEAKDFFSDYVKTVFDITLVDYKNPSQLDIDFIQRTVDELNSRDDASSEVKYFSRQEGILSHRILNQYNGYHEDESGYSTNGHDKSGKEQIFYEWTNNIYSKKEINSMLEYSFDGKVIKSTLNETYKCVLNATNGTTPENDPNYNKDYVFTFPKLSEYTLIN